MRDNSLIVWVALIAILLVVLNLPEPVSGRAKAAFREGVAPLQGALTSLSRTVSESVRSIRGIGGLVAENRQMAEELVRLRNEVRDLRALEKDNAELREQLQFLRGGNRPLVPCEVIARDITGWWQTIRLGKGSTDGIAPNMAVITSDGLVGRTVDVSLRTCDVLLISDPSCKVSARIARTGSFGLVNGAGPSGSGQKTCQMQFVNKDVPVLAGDEVITAGLGGVFPKGLLVGYVDQVRKDDSGLYQEASIIPKADLGTLTYVFVIAEQGNPIDDYLRQKKAERGEGEAP